MHNHTRSRSNPGYKAGQPDGFLVVNLHCTHEAEATSSGVWGGHWENTTIQ